MKKKKKKFHKNLGKASKFIYYLPSRGKPELKILRRLRAWKIALFSAWDWRRWPCSAPKKKRLTPKSFSHCSRIPWEYQRDRLPHHDDRYCLKSKGYVCVCGDDHDEAEGWWNGSWTDLTDFIKVWSVVVVYYNRESVVYNNYQCIENFFH